MIKKIIDFIAWLITAISILGVSYVLFEYYLYNNVYLEQQEVTRIKFEKANEALLAEIPPPEGVQQIKKFSSSNGFGVMLTVYYRTTVLMREETVNYYRQRISDRGFSLIGPYVRGTACIETDVNLEYDDFMVEFWYDYRKSPFSERVPPDWLVYLVGYTEKEVLTCPYKDP